MHSVTDDDLANQARFNQVVIDALRDCASCCLDNEEELYRVAHRVIQALRDRVSYEEFRRFREQYDGDMALDDFVLAVGWICGSGAVFDSVDIPGTAADWRDREQARTDEWINE